MISTDKIKNKIVCILVLCATIYMPVFGQAVPFKLWGKIMTKAGKPLVDVNIIIYFTNDLNNIAAYCISDENGAYSIESAYKGDSIKVVATGLNIGNYTAYIPSKTREFNIIVEEKTFILKEIVVKSTRLYAQEDTINYNVSSFLSKNELSLGDVLKKMPGITVGESGEISVKGKPVKHLYIEGMDMMKDRYGIVTNNIDPNAIATVQVFQNHQDIKALKGLTEEDKASINLKLRKGVKGVFNVIATLSGGVERKMLWSNNLMATLFKKNSQFFAIYKGNNTGEDLRSELQSFDFRDTGSPMLTQISFPIPPEISKEKYYFNRSHSFNYNNVYRVGRDAELALNAAYYTDCENRNSQTTVQHLLPDNTTIAFNEISDGKRKEHMVYLDFSIESNKKMNYLKEQIRLNYQREHYSMNIVNKEQITQNSAMDYFNTSNHLHWIKRGDHDKGMEINSKTGFSQKPHWLGVNIDLFNEDSISISKGLYQHAKTCNFYTENTMRFLQALIIGPVQIHLVTNMNVHHDRLESQLSRLLENDITTLFAANNLSMTRFNAGMGVECFVKFRRFSIDAYSPILYQHCILKEINGKTLSTKNQIVTSPKMTMRYNLNTDNTLSLSIWRSTHTPPLTKLYSQNILTKYNVQTVYTSQDLYNADSWQCSCSYNYKNLLSMLFVDISTGYTHTLPRILYGYSYKGNTEILNSVHTNQIGHSCFILLQGSKGFDWKRSKIGWEGRFIFGSNPILLQDQVIDSQSKILAFNLDFSAVLNSFLALNYRGAFANSTVGIKDGSNIPELTQFTNKATLTFSLPIHIDLNFGIYQYYNNRNTINKNYISEDIEVIYNCKRIRFSLVCTNLSNNQTYLNSTQSGLSSYITQYGIRGRSVLMKMRFKIL